MFAPEAMRAARAAMLQAALAAFFCDVRDDGSDELHIEIRFEDGILVIDFTELAHGKHRQGYSL